MVDEKNAAPPPVELTKRAIAQFKKAVVREKQNKNIGLRILLVQVGNGYRYDLQFESQERSGDHISNQSGIMVYIEFSFVSVLQGTQLDFYESKVGSGFIFHRPKTEA